MAHILFYVDEFFKEQIWPQFKKAARRECGSANKKLREIIAEWTDNHREGNPQQHIPRYIENGTPYFAPAKCSLNPCGREAVAVAEWKDGTRYFVCGVHLRSRVKRTKGWKVVGKVKPK